MAFADFLSPPSSKKVPQDEDSTDHIDSDTPRSGIATPIPDPSDKRLPGITHTDNYFNQVGASSKTSDVDGPLETPDIMSRGLTPHPLHMREYFSGDAIQKESAFTLLEKSSSASGDTGHEAPMHLEQEQAETSSIPSAAPQLWSLHPYPTPPTSGPPSVHNLRLGDFKQGGDGAADLSRSASIASVSFARRKSASEMTVQSRPRRASMWTPLSSILTASNVHAAHFSNPSDRTPSTASCTPSHSRLASGVSSHSASYEKLQRLTDDVEKSIPGTPTRALSNQTAVSNRSGDHPTTPAHESHTSHSSNGSAAAQSKSIRGKLTVKIAEARGLRRSKDPYVVAIFQRNELVSKGPRSEDDEDEDDDIPMKIPMGGIPISRQGSETGRSMAIPMKSRQSSSTSLTDYRDFKKKGRGGSFTAPKWDTEAIL